MLVGRCKVVLAATEWNAGAVCMAKGRSGTATATSTMIKEEKRYDRWLAVADCEERSWWWDEEGRRRLAVGKMESGRIQSSPNRE